MSDLTVGDRNNVRPNRSRSNSIPRSSDMGSQAGSSSDESIDLDNLPDDMAERFEILGIDASLAECGDDMLIRVSEESAIMEIAKR